MQFRFDFFILLFLDYHFGAIKKVVCALLCIMVKQDRNISFLHAVGRRLRQLREERGLSQEKMQFEKRIYLVYVENGKRNISITMLLDICRVYGITLADFFRGMEPYEGAIFLTENTDNTPDDSGKHDEEKTL